MHWEIKKFVETFQHYGVVYKADCRDGVMNFKEEAAQFVENVIFMPTP